MKLLILLLFYIISLDVFSIESNEFEYENNKVKLLLVEKKNNKLNLGLEFNLNKDWKIYWKYPGDSGSPPKISTKDKIIDDTVEINWPLPKDLYEKSISLTTRIYENNIILPISAEINNFDYEVKNDVSFYLEFQICKDICIPINTILKINIPKDNYFSKKNSIKINKFKKLIPKNINLSNVYKIDKVFTYNEDIIINIKKNIKDKNSSIKNIKAFIHNDKLPTLRFKRYNESKEDIKIILTGLKNDQNNIEEYKKSLIFIKINNDSFFFTSDIENNNNDLKYLSFKKIFLIIFISFIGGFILNFMPCVLPVLALKINGFLQQIETGDKNVIQKSSLAIVGGIIFTFIFFGTFSIILRILGKSVGWGMQFQSTEFLIILILVLLIFIFNLLGLIKIKIPKFLNNFVLSRSIKRYNNVYIKNFFLGILSTILATPCTAPFVGSAVSLALTQSFYMTYLIFFTMSVGKSVPYILFYFNPKVANYIPRPGKWLKYIKYLFAVILFLTLIWLASILISIYSTKTYTQNSEWENFSSKKISLYIEEGKTVFVDITAKWCVTCVVNKKLVLDDKFINNLFKKNNIIKVRGDWTQPNDDILIFLKRYNRYGVPFNVLFSDKYPEGLVFKEILTKKQLIESIK